MTERNEADLVEILSGVFEGKTTGTPIALLVRNEDQRSKDYGEIAHCFRPGHADYGFFCKYGFRDYRGGGRSSGRETIARVAAGAIAKKVLEELGVKVSARVTELAGVSLSVSGGEKEADERILKLREDGDSAGGVVECRVTGVPAGVGEPVFDKLDADLAKALMSIGAVKAVEIGDGVSVSRSNGSENNDAFLPASLEAEDSSEEAVSPWSDKSGEAGQLKLTKATNHSGGILGGMADGSAILLRVSFKPTPSISKEQQSVNEEGEPVTIAIKGRHDPTVVERACVVVESMTAITILDEMLQNMSSRMDYLKSVYS